MPASGTDHCGSSEVFQCTASAKRCSGHTLTFSVLRSLVFCVSCCLNLSEKLFDSISQRQTVPPKDPLAKSLPWQLVCIPHSRGILFLIKPAKCCHSAMLSACSFPAQSTSTRIRASLRQKILRDITVRACSTHAEKR